MNTTHYYINCTNGTKAMNKLQKEVSAYFRSLDGKLFDAVDLPELKKQILDSVEKINSSNKRCTPIKISFDPGHTKKFLRISGFYNDNVYLYKATLSHLSTVEYKSISNN